MSKLLRLVWSDPNNRHLLIAAFAQVLIATCLLVAALNEESRMQLAQIGVEAKSIEHGAELYSKYCAICHGINGYGLAGKAPALNNPQLFGHDFFPDVTHQIDSLYAEKLKLTHERSEASTTETRKSEINGRIAEIDKIIVDLEQKRKIDVQSTLEKGYDPSSSNYNRLRQVNWEGTTKTFILTTLIHGRPNSSSYWPMAMPAYSQEAFAGQMLERYELEDLTAYIMNWDKGNSWALEDLFAVNQFAILAKDSAPYIKQIQMLTMSYDTIPQPVGTDVKAIATEITKLNGDPSRGDELYHGKAAASLTGQPLPCTGCHQQTANTVGPMTNGTYARVVNNRLKQPEFTGYTPEEYLIDSIVNPNHYIVPGFQDLMVKDLGTDSLYIQDLADIVAYLMTQK